MLRHPVSPDYAQLLVGMPVCAVMKDGSERIGLLSSVDSSKLVLNEDSTPTGPTAQSKSKAKTSKASKPHKAAVRQTDETVPPGPGTILTPPIPPRPAFGPKAVLELSSVELLFPLII